jgi:hypothetical protein
MREVTLPLNPGEDDKPAFQTRRARIAGSARRAVRFGVRRGQWVKRLDTRKSRGASSAGAARRECAALVAGLPIPTPFDAQGFCEWLSQDRGRRIRVIGMQLPTGGPSGLLVSMPSTDLLVYDRRASHGHRELIITNLAVRLLMFDDAEPRGLSSEESRVLFPDLAPGIVRAELGQPPPA